MKTLQTTILACLASVAAGPLAAVTYDASVRPDSLTDANGTVSFKYEGTDITKLVFEPNDGATLVLDGDALSFAAGATIVPGQGGDSGGMSVISNSFTAAGALEFRGVTNMTWQAEGNNFLNIDDEAVFSNVDIAEIAPAESYGKTGSAWGGIGESTLYTPFNVVRDGNFLRYELQRMSSDIRRGMFIQLEQDGDNVKAKLLSSCFKRSQSEANLGESMFVYNDGVVSRASDTTDDASTGYQKPKTISLAPRSGGASRLTFAVSGAQTLPAVSGSGVEVTFDANPFGELAQEFKSGTFAATADWQTLTTDHQLKDFEIRSGRLYGEWLKNNYPDGVDAIAFGWTNNNEFAGCQMQQLDDTLIRTVDLEFRQNGDAVEVRWVRCVYTYSNASTYYGKKYLTTADSNVTMAAVGNIRVHWVSTKPLEPAATIAASGENAMTDSAYVIKGDDNHPVAFNIAARALPSGTTDADGAVTVNATAVGAYNNGLCDKSAITLRNGAKIVQSNNYFYSFTHSVLTLDGAEFVAAADKDSYLNYLVLTNAAAISGGKVNAGYASGTKWLVTGEGASTCDANLNLLSNGGTTRELEIAVEDTAEGDDFIVNGDISQQSGSHPNGAFVKTGEGTMRMNGVIRSTNQPTRLREGTLLLGASGAVVSGHSLQLDGGTLALAAGTTNEAANVSVTADSVLSFGDNAALTLANLTISEGQTLTLAGDVPKTGLKVASTLDAATLKRIVFADGRKGRVGQTDDGHICVMNGFMIIVM